MTLLRANRENEVSDDELIRLLKDDDENRDALRILYTRHKEYCLNFMKSMYKDIDDINDIYHDAIFTFNEKINTPDFSLSCRIQTYLNSICRNQILKKYNHAQRYTIRSSDENHDFLETIEDQLEEIDDINNERIKVMENILNEWKSSANKCYQLLMFFWYKKRTMEEIASIMNFSNADSAKSQKAKCQNKLKIELNKRLKAGNDN